MREYLKLCRAEYFGFAYMAVLGALCVGGPNLRVELLVAIVAVNVLTLMWTFAHNDYCDLNVDRLRSELDERVLVKGTVRPVEACWIIAIGIGLALGICYLSTRSFAPLFALSLSVVLAMAYNKVSKSLFGADVLFAASATFLALFGMLAAGDGVAPIPSIAYVVLAMVFLEHLFFNMVEGGMKDADLDGLGGVNNVATRLIECRDGKLTISPRFKAIAYVIKVGAIVCAFVPFLFLDEPYYPLQIAALVVFAVLSLFFLHRLTSAREYDWQRMGHDIIRQEMASRSLLPFLLLGRIGIAWVVVILMAPFVWYLSTVYFLHGRLLALPKRF